MQVLLSLLRTMRLITPPTSTGMPVKIIITAITARAVRSITAWRATVSPASAVPFTLSWSEWSRSFLTTPTVAFRRGERLEINGDHFTGLSANRLDRPPRSLLSL